MDRGDVPQRASDDRLPGRARKAQTGFRRTPPAQAARPPAAGASQGAGDLAPRRRGGARLQGRRPRLAGAPQRGAEEDGETTAQALMFVGLDGFRRGWVAVRLHDDGAHDIVFLPELRGILAWPFARAMIDM